MYYMDYMDTIWFNWMNIYPVVNQKDMKKLRKPIWCAEWIFGSFLKILQLCEATNQSWYDRAYLASQVMEWNWKAAQANFTTKTYHGL